MVVAEKVEDLANININEIEKQIELLQRKDEKIKKNILSLYAEGERIVSQLDRAYGSLDKAKKQIAKLKKYVWTSDNPNIVDLRNQILLAAKLIQDTEIKGKK